MNVREEREWGDLSGGKAATMGRRFGFEGREP